MATKPIREYLAEQTGTRAEDWCPIPTSTTLYKRGYRWWNKVTEQFARRVIMPGDESLSGPPDWDNLERDLRD